MRHEPGLHEALVYGINWKWREGVSANLLRQLDDDPIGAADIAESVAVLVAPQLADELCTKALVTDPDRNRLPLIVERSSGGR